MYADVTLKFRDTDADDIVGGLSDWSTAFVSDYTRSRKSVPHFGACFVVAIACFSHKNAIA